MKKYSTLLLSSAVLMASLAQNPVVSANTTTSTTGQTTSVVQPPTTTKPAVTTKALTESATQIPQTVSKPTAPLTTQQKGQTLSIFYNRSAEQQHHKIQYAVWSTENGQDDVKWYVAGDRQTDIPLSQHKGYGQYIIHSYITVQGKLIFLEESSATVTKPTPSITTAVSDPGVLDIRIQNLPAHLAEVRVPIWSSKNGQDDLKWYTARYNPDGSYSLRVYLKDHKFDTGTYSIHLYTKETASSALSYVSASSFTIGKAHIPTKQEPSISLKDIQKTKGSYTIVVQEQATTKKIKQVEVATWSTANQSNIKWREAPLQNGVYQTAVTFQEHQAHNGHYQNHVYVTYEDGTRVGYIAETVDLSAARLPIQFSHHLTHTGNMGITIENVYDNTPVQYAVWTEGYYGHVAVVTEVASPTSIRVKEANYAGKQYIGDFRGWFNPVADGVTEYIYPN